MYRIWAGADDFYIIIGQDCWRTISGQQKETAIISIGRKPIAFYYFPVVT